MLVEKSLFLPIIRPFASQHSALDVFNGPAAEVFIDPWVSYLKTLGVKFQTRSKVEQFTVQEGKVKEVLLSVDGKQQIITADIYVFALPVEVMTKLCDKKEIKSQIPSLANLDKLNVELSSGIQFFHTHSNDSDLPQGWTVYSDSPWGILGFHQSKAVWPNYQFPAPIKGVLTFTWSNFDDPGVVYHKPAKDCNAVEMKEEILAQVKMHKGSEYLNTLDIISWNIDPDIVFSDKHKKMEIHATPLFVQLPGHHQHQPNAYTEAENLFLASDYVRTSYDLATMEAANEAGRRATNAILARTNSSAKPCFVKKNVTTGFGFFQFFDRYIFKLQQAYHNK
jgi:uncharacterized protein with NAD-binding domain and iron-sulfur cluster